MYEKEKDQYTFKPDIKGNIVPKTRLLNVSNKQKKIRVEDTSVERVAQGRKEKERVNAILQNGYWQISNQKNVKKPVKKPANVPKKGYLPKSKNERLMEKVNNFCTTFLLTSVVSHRKYSNRPAKEYEPEEADY